jgi:hypothetical protein
MEIVRSMRRRDGGSKEHAKNRCERKGYKGIWRVERGEGIRGKQRERGKGDRKAGGGDRKNQ